VALATIDDRLTAACRAAGVEVAVIRAAHQPRRRGTLTPTRAHAPERLPLPAKLPPRPRETR
jgi:hypothetical protein